MRRWRVSAGGRVCGEGVWGECDGVQSAYELWLWVGGGVNYDMCTAKHAGVWWCTQYWGVGGGVLGAFCVQYRVLGADV